MSVAIINLYEVYNPHTVLLRSLLKSRAPSLTVHILNEFPKTMKISEYKQTYSRVIVITSDEFLYFFQNLRDEYKLDGCVFINVRNLYPGMITYKYKSFRHIFNALCKGHQEKDLTYSIVKSPHHNTFFDGVTGYELLDYERDILTQFPTNTPNRPLFQLTEYAGFWIIGDDKRAQRTVGSVFSSFVPIEYIHYHDDTQYINRISNYISKHPNKRFAILYFEPTGIPEFFTIYRLLSSAMYEYGNINLLTIRDSFKPEYLDMYDRWENGGKEIGADELKPMADEAFKYIQYINPPAIDYDDLIDLLLDHEKRPDIIYKYGNLPKYSFKDFLRDTSLYFGDSAKTTFIKDIVSIKSSSSKGKEQTNLSTYAVKPFYEVPYSLQGEGVALHLPPLEESNMETVSVVTPTRYRGLLLMNTVWSLNNSVYPHRLIEWVILDNGDKAKEQQMPEQCRMDIWLPRIKSALNPQITLKYYQEEADKYTLGELRNKAVEKATGKIIVFMDDDDFYPAESILARVKALHIRPDISLVGCVRIVNLNIETGKWTMTGMEKYLSEASLAFRRRFWEKRPFARQKCNEIALFIYGREDSCCHILSQFVIFSVYHNANFTGNLRQIRNDKHHQNMDIELPEEVRNRFNEWLGK